MGIESATRYTCDLCGKSLHQEGEFDRIDPDVPSGWVQIRVGMNLIYCGEDCARAALPRVRDEQVAGFAKSIEQRFENEIKFANAAAKKAAT